MKSNTHGLVERKVLNVDRHRERCPISELKQAKLRRVAFCVDVEIAPLPKYAEGGKTTNGVCATGDKTQKRKITEKGEGEALKNPRAVEDQKEHDGEVKATGEGLPKEPECEGSDIGPPAVPIDAKEATPASQPEKAADTKKKEKKKKSEEERKARKEKKRKLAEANGTIPMEIYYDSDSSSGSTHTADRPKSPQVRPTTDPVRIYRRCCQLRETPILKKLTEQLADPANCSSAPGLVEKLDLTGYWMQLADLVTLGDYLAVVPVKEVILENCGLTDEGLRVILAGLLAARKPGSKRRKHSTVPDGLTSQGGVVERLVLKNNKIGPEGWKHLCLFIYLCRSLKFLDISSIPFPNPAKKENGIGAAAQQTARTSRFDPSHLLAQSIGDRLGGSTLSLLNMGETGISTQQLGFIIDGVIKCGVKRIGFAHNNLDAVGVKHMARYLSSGKCDGLDLGGNDLRDQLDVLVDSINESCPLWALSLAECNLKPASLCKLLPKLSKLPAFRFIDLSHNHELFSSNPSAIPVLRRYVVFCDLVWTVSLMLTLYRYLPKMRSLKRIHFADCAMSSEQAIALAEIIPEIPGLAHISFLENPEIVRLTDATTEEGQEEACALFASLLAATRVSTSLVCVDIEVPTEKSSELVKALAKQVVAYCLANLERLPVSELTATALAQSELSAAKPNLEYPDVMQHLLGHDVKNAYDPDSDVDTAPDDDYVIGGTGVVKALACCLNNRGDESRRQSGEFIRDVESGIPPSARPDLPAGKAKDMSKHLLLSARKIRLRLQPAITKARASRDDTHAYRESPFFPFSYPAMCTNHITDRLLFLDNTLKGIIKRFEDEFPDTREDSPHPGSRRSSEPSSALSSSAPDIQPPTAGSDVEDEAEPFSIKPPLSRSNSIVSMTSRALSAEEGRVLRAGHKFRAGIFKPEHYLLLSGIEDVGNDPNHVRILHEMLDELDDDELRRKAEEVGVVRVFQEERDTVLEKLKESDPEHWERFAESQLMASKNRMNGGEQDGKVIEGRIQEVAERGVDEAIVVD